MSTPDEIAPALTPEEWSNEEMDDPSILGDLRYVGADCPNKMQKVVALANSLLLPDSQYKFARQDAEIVSDTSHMLAVMSQRDDVLPPLAQVYAIVASQLQGVAAKLTALLPPA